MKIFISWSGPRSLHIAKALRWWLPKVIQSIKPWMSEKDIDAGAQWFSEISSGLNESKAGLVCVTPENKENSWLMFEAGALSKTVEQQSFVCPLLYDMNISELTGPLSQFQAQLFNEANIYKVLTNLNNNMDFGKLSPKDLEEAFEKWWPELDTKIKKAPKAPKEHVAPRTPEDKLEEILSLSREQLRNEIKALEYLKLLHGLMKPMKTSVGLSDFRDYPNSFNFGKEVGKAFDRLDSDTLGRILAGAGSNTSIADTISNYQAKQKKKSSSSKEPKP